VAELRAITGETELRLVLTFWLVDCGGQR
jgi:hypothetical protein